MRQGVALAALCAACFLACCAAFWLAFDNPWPAILGAPVLAWIALYSFTKRFTALCHLFLGGALAVSPLAALIAVNPDLLFGAGGPAPQALTVAALSAFVLFWVAGFDVAYALQDIDFDRATGLRSIPARLGPAGALAVSRALHGLAVVALAFAGLPDPTLGPLFFVACVGVGALLLWEHTVLARRGAAGLPLAFFTINGLVSLLLGAAGVLDRLL